MKTKQKTLRALTARDVMTGPVATIPQGMTLQAAAQMFRHKQISGAPVVDDQGRCVGVLSAADFIRWADEGGPSASHETRQIRACPFQEEIQRQGGQKEVRCTLPKGSCPLQSVATTLSGKQAVLCFLPQCVVVDWQQVIEEIPTDQVRHYMTADIVTVQPTTSLPQMARMMIDAHIHRLIVVDAAGKPVGIVTSTDLLAALATQATGA
jgi:CBS domain-containing protein